MNTCPHRESLPAMPAGIAALPVDDRGYPVPWFVLIENGAPDFRIIGRGKLETAIREHRCWICGEPLDGVLTFVLGPMCTISRTTSEPPSHPACALFAAKGCPFLTIPSARYRKAGIPDTARGPAGEFIDRNPGVCALWTTSGYTPFPARGGFLITVGDPFTVAWYAQGRPATRDEVEASVTSGLPILQAAADKDANPREANIEINDALHYSMQFWPL